jgi:hypothetical protein
VARKLESTRLEEDGYRRYKAHAAELGMTIEAYSNASLVLIEWYFYHGLENGTPPVEEMLDQLRARTSRQQRADVRAFDRAMHARDRAA